MYHSYSEITNPSDRMRWCRYSLGLLQKDVAAMVGMEEWLYRDLESGTFFKVRPAAAPAPFRRWAAAVTIVYRTFEQKFMDS